MIREEIENTPKIVDNLLDESVTVDARTKLYKRLEELYELAIKVLEQEQVLAKIRAEISCNIIADNTSGNVPARLRADWAAANQAHMIDISIIDKYLDKYNAKSEESE